MQGAVMNATATTLQKIIAIKHSSPFWERGSDWQLMGNNTLSVYLPDNEETRYHIGYPHFGYFYIVAGCEFYKVHWVAVSRKWGVREIALSIKLPTC